jgi:hypothetical protein
MIAQKTSAHRLFPFFLDQSGAALQISQFTFLRPESYLPYTVPQLPQFQRGLYPSELEQSVEEIVANLLCTTRPALNMI